MCIHAYVHVYIYIEGGTLWAPFFFTRILCVFDDFKLDNIQNYTNTHLPVMAQLFIQVDAKVYQEYPRFQIGKHMSMPIQLCLLL